MHPTLLCRCLLFVLSCAAAAPAVANEAAPVVIPSLAPWITSSGRISPGAWRHAAHFSIDNEIKPGRNRPARVPTTVAVGYTSNALWLHFVAADPDPAAIRAHYRRHDEIVNDDNVGLIFNPFNDTQWAYEFFCSASGTELDVFRQQGQKYESFDAVWYCDADLTSTGYTVTMQIPFGSLKLPHDARPQVWRMLLIRKWSRSLHREMAQVRFNFNYDNNCVLCQTEVVRTATPIRSAGTHFQIIPAVTVSRTDTRAGPNSGLETGSPEVSGQLDARWAIRPNLEWSATLNPNFSQVAPDVLQSTVNQRFALDYPENRPFFQRGTWLFNTPGFKFNSFGGRNNRFVDTRRIAAPDWASKVVGQIGNHAFGMLLANDSVTNILLPGQQTSSIESFGFGSRDALLRYRHDFEGHSSVGMLATSREGGGYDNRMLAFDGSLQFDPSDSMTVQTGYSATTYPGQVAAAFGTTPGSVNGNSWVLSLNRSRPSYVAQVTVGHVDPGFRADLGYLPQVGFSDVHTHFEYNWYSHTAWWNNGGFGGDWNWMQAANHGPVLNRRMQVYAFVHSVGQSHAIFFARHEDQYVGRRIFALDQFQLNVSAVPSRWLSFEVDTIAGDGIDYVGAREGDLLSVAPSFTLSPGKHLKIAFVGNFERLDVQAGRVYTADLYDLRVNWYFNSRLFVRAIGQEQDVRRNTALYPDGAQSRTRTLGTQWLVGYELTPWTGFFVGFTNGYLGTGDAGLLQRRRMYFLKLSHGFQF